MGRIIEISPEQKIVNMINARVDFTLDLNDNTGRYVVGKKELFKGINPSLNANTWEILEEALQSSADTLGGWENKEGIYYVDLGNKYTDLALALYIADKRGEEAIYDSLEDKVIWTKEALGY